MPAPLLTVLLYVTVALCWSGSWTAGKLGVGAVPPLELSSIRFAIAGLIMLALARARGVISQAAAELGLSRQALYRRMERLGIARP